MGSNNRNRRKITLIKFRLKSGKNIITYTKDLEGRLKLEKYLCSGQEQYINNPIFIKSPDNPTIIFKIFMSQIVKTHV
jgi:hypothetical protein